MRVRVIHYAVRCKPECSQQRGHSSVGRVIPNPAIFKIRGNQQPVVFIAVTKLKQSQYQTRNAPTPLEPINPRRLVDPRRSSYSKKQHQARQAGHINKIRQSTKHQFRKHADGVTHTLAAYFGSTQFDHVLQMTLQGVAVRTLLHDAGWFSAGLDRRKWHLHGRAWEVRMVERGE